MRRLLASTALAALLALPAAAQDAGPDGRAFPAVLAGQAILPAETLVPAPADAPEHFRHAGKFTTPDRHRADALGSVPGMDGKRPTGLSLPFDGQPVQGFSGIKAVGDGTYWTLSDNGFGSKINSSDALLMLHHIRPDWQAGTVERMETVFLTDPNRIAPFPIVSETDGKRYLTGADFDIESIQPDETGFWVGEEFGPWLLRFDRAGRLESVHATRIGETEVMSPDNPTLVLPGKPDAKPTAFNIKRSGGYEGLARSPDGSKLYGLLEGPVTMDGKAETAPDGRTALRIVEFDVGSKDWTGRSWLYPLPAGGEAIGDFNMIDATHALVIERDNGAGREAQACAGEPDATCFATPAKLKRIARIALTPEGAGEPVAKIGYIDLMDVQDPKGLARQGGIEGGYDMPFVTIENVDRVDETHIIVGNDNNLPFSAGRALDKADDTEFVLLEVGDFLRAE
jgi:hypothetical protein